MDVLVVLFFFFLVTNTNYYPNYHINSIHRGIILLLAFQQKLSDLMAPLLTPVTVSYDTVLWGWAEEIVNLVEKNQSF